ncbi:MAG TPA: amidase family protein [Candidatus Woesearchaeota archaeon]|nr:amidase family protein [Candidatus Woesearchaeota archaeon]
MIIEHINNVNCEKIDLTSFAKSVIDEIKDINSKIYCFNCVCEDSALKDVQIVSKRKKLEKGTLAGLIISVKDNICVKDVETTAGSKILSGYKPVFNATVVEKLKMEGAIIVGKTSMDEFGFGGFNINTGVDFKVPLNPIDLKRSTGGSSGGSGAVTKVVDFAHVSIAESTGGSIECPASFCGDVGFCPTYGRISRFGLISYANSLDKIGILSKDVEDIIPVFNAVAGKDNKDPTCITDTIKLKKAIAKKKFKIGIISESFDDYIADYIKEHLRVLINLIKKKHEIFEVSLPFTFKYGVPTYYIIATSEASTNLSKFCGLRYGIQADPKTKTFSNFFSEIRSENLGKEAKRRILLGTYARMAGYRDEYYLKATKVRRLIIDEYKEAFKKYDVLISPTTPMCAPLFSEISKMDVVEQYLFDQLTVGPNLAGLPHASIPFAKFGEMPLGLMVVSDHYKEQELIDFLFEIEKVGKENGI